MSDLPMRSYTIVRPTNEVSSGLHKCTTYQRCFLCFTQIHVRPTDKLSSSLHKCTTNQRGLLWFTQMFDLPTRSRLVNTNVRTKNEVSFGSHKYMYDLPTRSRLGPTSIAFQENERFDGQLVKPSWCLVVRTTYLEHGKHRHNKMCYQRFFSLTECTVPQNFNFLPFLYFILCV